MAVAITRVMPTSLAPPAMNGLASQVQSIYFDVNITTAFANNDTIDVGYLPKGAVPIGGYFAAVDLDTGTESLDLDLGIAANGVDSADPDYFMNGGLFSGDLPIATDLIITNAANYRPITGPFPTVQQMGAKTTVQLKCIAAANATGTGRACGRIDYLTPGSPTS